MALRLRQCTLMHTLCVKARCEHILVWAASVTQNFAWRTSRRLRVQYQKKPLGFTATSYLRVCLSFAAPPDSANLPRLFAPAINQLFLTEIPTIRVALKQQLQHSLCKGILWGSWARRAAVLSILSIAFLVFIYSLFGNRRLSDGTAGVSGE